MSKDKTDRNWFARHKILTGFGVLVILGIIISATSDSDSSTPTASNSSDGSTQAADASTAQPAAAPEKIDVKTLGDAFNANQVAAEKEWKDKSVEFAAEITNITDSGLSFSKAVSSEEYSLTQISCNLKDKDQALTVKNGQTVTVQGVIGGQTIGVIDMKDCSIVQ